MRCVKESIRTPHEVLIQRVEICNKGDKGIFSSASSPSRLLTNRHHGSRKAADDHRVKTANINTEFQGIGTDNASNISLFEIILNDSPFVWTIASPVRGDAAAWQTLTAAKCCDLCHVSGFGKAESLHTAPDLILDEISSCRKAAFSRTPRIVQPKSLLRPGRAIVCNLNSCNTSESFGKRRGITDGCGGENKLRVGVIIITDAPQPP